MANYAEMGERWRAISLLGKIGFTMGLLAILLTFFTAIVWLSRDTYQVLFSDLEPQDAAAMIAEIEKLKTPYKISDEGRTILVDKDAVYKTRLKVMGNGVPLRGTVGFEIFNNTDFGMTEFSQKINFQRALQGELARTIMAFDEVKSARVHLVLPESGLFKKSSAIPKASVTIATNDEKSLSPEQIQGIQRLVAAAVPEIEPKAVTIIDQRGVAITRNAGHETQEMAVEGGLEAKKKMEAYLVRKIADVLDKAFGPGQSIISVDVTLNYDQSKLTREDVIPHAKKEGDVFGVVTRRKQQVSDVKSQKESTDTSPAKDSGGRYGSYGGARLGSGASTLETEYKVGRVVEQIVFAPGAIKKVSVGVMLPTDTDAAKLSKIREMVSMAVGLTPSRGDAIAVYSVENYVRRKSIETSRDANTQPESTDNKAISSAAINKSLDSGNPLLFWILGAGFIAVFVSLVLVLNRKFSTSTFKSKSLTSKERSELLSQIRQWIESGEKTVQDGRSS